MFKKEKTNSTDAAPLRVDVRKAMNSLGMKEVPSYSFGNLIPDWEPTLGEDSTPVSQFPVSSRFWMLQAILATYDQLR
jgi:hypothetical protein